MSRLPRLWLGTLAFACAVASLRAAGLAQPVDARAAVIRAIDDGRQAIDKGEPARALDIFTKASADAERLQDPAVLAQALGGLGWAQWATGKYRESLETRTHALELFRGVNDRGREAWVLRGIGETLYS